MNYNPIILALDYNNMSEAEAMLSKVRPHIGMIKIGLELFTAHGRDALSLSKNYNIPIFLDLKLHDIPKTVAKTLNVVCGMLAPIQGNHYVSIHCFGGQRMLEESVKVCRGSNVIPAGVTLLTSVGKPELVSFGFGSTVPGSRVRSLINLGTKCVVMQPKPEGMDTFIIPPAQLSIVRKHFGNNLTLITPGIRAEGVDLQGHKTAKSASFALRQGATWLVIGRPITQAADPVAAAQHFQKIAEKY
jgi:orotidine-5'-phosphate decarboxylase